MSSSTPRPDEATLASDRHGAQWVDHYARSLLQAYHANLPPKIPDAYGQKVEVPKEKHAKPGRPHSRDRPVRVGIVGAGAAGLCIALTLEALIKEGLQIEYEILEAQPEASNPPQPQDHPLGGRLWTYKFPKCDSGSEPGIFDYYDRGAMRFPDSPLMKPLFDLFKYLNLETIPYILSEDCNLKLFNNRPPMTVAEIKRAEEEGNFDPFETGVSGLEGSAQKMLDDQTRVFRDALRRGNGKIGPEGWRWITGPGGIDEWSTRGFMNIRGADGVGRLTGEVIDFIEAFDTGTGRFDHAFSGTILGSLEFDYGPGVKWYTIPGGTEKIAEAMADRLETGKIVNGARVTRIEPVDPQDYNKGVRVHHTDPQKPKEELKYKEYDHVVSTVPFGCLRMIDTTKLDFSWPLQTAIRCLTYGSSVKVGIRFKTRWWETKCGQKGGTSSTDRPSRTITYPSYGIGSENEGATMIASYTWVDDALRFGGLCRGKGSEPEDILMRIVLEDLAAVHAPKVDYAYLRDQVIDWDAWNWYDEANSSGAFAVFGPGQFRDLYPRVTAAHHGVFHFAGEATSVHHGWVVGAINSAVRAVLEIGCYENWSSKFFDSVDDMWPGINEFSKESIRMQTWLGEHGVNSHDGYSTIHIKKEQ